MPQQTVVEPFIALTTVGGIVSGVMENEGALSNRGLPVDEDRHATIKDFEVMRPFLPLKNGLHMQPG
jgi:hypothetical protein